MGIDYSDIKIGDLHWIIPNNPSDNHYFLEENEQGIQPGRYQGGKLWTLTIDIETFFTASYIGNKIIPPVIIFKEEETKCINQIGIY